MNIGANQYVHKFKLADEKVTTEATTKASYDNLKDSIQPTKPDATWFMSSIRKGFDTPSGDLSDGEYVKVTNLTSGGTIRVQAKGGEAVVNPATSKLVWSTGDTLSIETQGRYVESASTTISKGGAKVTLSLGTADDSPAVNL